MKVFLYDNDFNLTNYLNALESVGITPVLSKKIENSKNCDALVLTGGGNMSPVFYGVTPGLYDLYDLETDAREFFLLNNFYYQNKKVLGICKGLQIINVYFGGTISFIDKNVNPTHYSLKGDLFHNVTFYNNKKLNVNSMHKQQIELIGKNLEIVAKSDDGVIEAISADNNRIFGTQFHPERMSEEFTKNFFNWFFYEN